MNKLIDLANRYKKAVAGFVLPGAIQLWSAVQQGSDHGTHVTTGEWLAVVGASLATAGIVATVTNKPKV